MIAIKLFLQCNTSATNVEILSCASHCSKVFCAHAILHGQEESHADSYSLNTTETGDKRRPYEPLGAGKDLG